MATILRVYVLPVKKDSAALAAILYLKAQICVDLRLWKCNKLTFIDIYCGIGCAMFSLWKDDLK